MYGLIPEPELSASCSEDKLVLFRTGAFSVRPNRNISFKNILDNVVQKFCWKNSILESSKQSFWGPEIVHFCERQIVHFCERQIDHFLRQNQDVFLLIYWGPKFKTYISYVPSNYILPV